MDYLWLGKNERIWALCSLLSTVIHYIVRYIIQLYNGKDQEIIRDCTFFDYFLSSSDSSSSYSIQLSIWSFFLVDFLLTACHYIVCYVMRVPLVLSVISSLSWVLWTWWIMLCDTVTITDLLEPLAIVLFFLAKKPRSYSLVVLSAVLLVVHNKLSSDHSLLIMVALCYIIDHSFLFSLWLSVVCIFIWDSPWIQLIILFPLLLSQWTGTKQIYIQSVSLFLHFFIHFPKFIPFSLSQFTQFLSFLICIESLSISIPEIAVVGALILSWNQSPWNGIMHILSLVQALRSAQLRMKDRYSHETIMHFIILFSIGALCVVEVIREYMVAINAARYGNLWSFTNDIRSDIRDVRSFVDDRGLWQDLYSLTTPSKKDYQIGERDLMQFFLLNEEGSSVFQSFPFSYIFLSPFDTLPVSCVDGNVCLYCLLKNRVLDVKTFGLRLDNLSLFRLIYASEDSLFLIYSIVHDNTLTVIYSKGGHKFEVYVDRDKYPEFLKGHKTVKEVCLSDVINNESKKTLPESAYITIFGTSDVWEIISTIAKNGEPQYTVQQRRKMTEDKRKQIIDYIAKTYVDPKTNLPHPVTRIENGLNTIKGLKIDLNQSASRQGDEIVQKLKTKMSFLKNETHGYIYIDLAHSGKAANVLRKWCSIRSSHYTDTEYKAEVTFTTTTMVTFMKELTDVTGGAYRFENDNQLMASIDQSVSNKEPKGKKGKKGKH